MREWFRNIFLRKPAKEDDREGGTMISEIIDELNALRSLVNEEVDRIINLLDTGSTTGEYVPVAETNVIEIAVDPIVAELDERDSLVITAETPTPDSTTMEKARRQRRSSPYLVRPRRIAEREVQEYWSARSDKFIAPRLVALSQFENRDEQDYFSSSWGTACHKFMKEGKMERKTENSMNFYRWLDS